MPGITELPKTSISQDLSIDIEKTTDRLQRNQGNITTQIVNQTSLLPAGINLLVALQSTYTRTGLNTRLSVSA